VLQKAGGIDAFREIKNRDLAGRCEAFEIGDLDLSSVNYKKKNG